MSINFNIPIEEPTLMDLLNQVKADIFRTLNCHALATVKSFNSTDQTVEATIDYCRTRFERNRAGQYVPKYVNYPTLIDVPVISLCGGDGGLTFPITAGDKCLILFNDRDISNWFAEQTPGGPNASARMHSLSDGIALVGLNSIGTYVTNKVKLFKGDTQITLGTKINISNASEDLKDILENLVTAINDLVTATAAITVICAAPGNPSSVPVNVAAITAVATTLTGIATDLGGLLE